MYWPHASSCITSEILNHPWQSTFKPQTASFACHFSQLFRFLEHANCWEPVCIQFLKVPDKQKRCCSVHKLAIPYACLYRTTTFCYSTLLAFSLMSIEYFQLWKLHAAIFRKINGFSYTKVTMKYKLPAISSTWFR